MGITAVKHHEGISVPQNPSQSVHRFFTETNACHTTAGAGVGEGIHIDQYIRSFRSLIASGAFAGTVLRMLKAVDFKASQVMRGRINRSMSGRLRDLRIITILAGTAVQPALPCFKTAQVHMDFFQAKTVHRGRAKGAQRFPAGGCALHQLISGVSIIGYGAGSLFGVYGFLSQYEYSSVGSPFQRTVFEHIAVKILNFIPVIAVIIPKDFFDLDNCIPDKHTNEQIALDSAVFLGFIHISEDPGVFCDLHKVTSLVRRKLFRFFLNRFFFNGLFYRFLNSLRLFFRFFYRLLDRFRFFFGIFHRLLNGFLNRFHYRFFSGFLSRFLRRKIGRFIDKIFGKFRIISSGFFGRFFSRHFWGDGFFSGFCRFAFRFIFVSRNAFIFFQIFLCRRSGFIFTGDIFFGRNFRILFRLFFRRSAKKCFGLNDFDFFFHDNGEFIIAFQRLFSFRFFSQGNGNTAGKHQGQ